MSDPLRVLVALGVVLLGARLAWGDAPATPAKIFPYPVHQTVLDNGLKVVVVPFDSPGIVAYWTVVRAGSRNEIEPGKSGFAHFFEHMMFRGTERYSKAKYNDALKELGADSNAFTSDDLTAYHILAPSSALPTLMTLESDRFMNLKYSVEDFKKEAGAILGEYNKNASSPFLSLLETLRDRAFRVHTYRHTTLGFLRDIQDMPNQYDYSLQFFDRFYRPENCILLLVGDVDPAKAVAMARTHYGAWARGSHRFEAPAEPPPDGEKRATVAWKSPTQPYLYVGYRGPAFSADAIDMPALDLIAQLVFAEAAPLYQRLVVEEQEVDLLSGSAQDRRDPYLFDILARVKRTERVAYVEQAITEALQTIREAPVDAARLDRVKSHMKYSFAVQLRTAGEVARILAGYLSLTGDPETVNGVHALYDRLTPADVQEVARKYFVPEGRTAVTLAHEKAEAAGGGR